MTSLRSARTLVAGLVVIASAACGRASDHHPSHGGSDSSGGTVTQDLPGALPVSADSMSGDAFRDFVRHLHYGGGGNFQRPCTGTPDCDGPAPKDTTVVSINAVRGQDSLSIASLSPNGVVAAELVNRGRFEERLLQIKSDSSRYHYYLVVYPGASDSIGTWHLEELETHGNTASHRSIATGQFVGCMHHFDPSGPRAAFKSCADAERVHEHLLLRASTSPPGYTSPPWVSCILGCCSAQGT